MKELFLDMFRYHHHFNQKMIEELQKHETKLPLRTISLFCHVLNAHQIWNSRILNTPSLGVHDSHTLTECKPLDEQNFHATMKILETADFQQIIQYTNSKGQAFSNTTKDILLHVINHTTHHRGQIVSDFRQAGIAPIVTDYIFYKRV